MPVRWIWHAGLRHRRGGLHPECDGPALLVAVARRLVHDRSAAPLSSAREHRPPCAHYGVRGHYRAAVDGTREIGLAVQATTLTVAAVSYRWAKWRRVVGQVFPSNLATATVAAAVLISQVELCPRPDAVADSGDHAAGTAAANTRRRRRRRAFEAWMVYGPPGQTLRPPAGLGAGPPRNHAAAARQR